MITPTWVFLGVLVPAVIGLALPWVVFYRRCPRWLARIASAVTIAMGFEVGFMATYGWPKIPPIEAHEWLLVALVPAALTTAILVTATRTPATVIWILRLLIAFAVAPILLQPYIQYTWSGTQSMMWLMGLGAGAAMFGFLLLRLASSNDAAENDNTPADGLPWALAIVAGGTGITILMSGSQTLGQLGISLASVLTGIAAVSWITRKTAYSLTSHLDVTITLLIGIWLCGYFYAQLSAAHAILLAFAPLTAWIGNLLPKSPKAAWETLIRLTPVTLLVIGVVGSAIVKFTQESTYDGYGYYQTPRNNTPHDHCPSLTSKILQPIGPQKPKLIMATVRH